MPSRRANAATEDRRGGMGGGGGTQQHREDTVNKINYAKCPRTHQSRGNNGGVRVRTHTACMLSPLNDRQLTAINCHFVSPRFAVCSFQSRGGWRGGGTQAIWHESIFCFMLDDGDFFFFFELGGSNQNNIFRFLL